jgi:type IV pilus assembly protein PilY1
MSTCKVARLGATLLALVLSHASLGEDIDIFGQPPGVTNGAPNVLFILDNSANWARSAQKWPAPSNTQGEGELLAIQTLLAQLDKPLNVGLMMLTNKNEIGGYVRFGVRPMLNADKTLTNDNDKLRAMLAAIQAKVNDPTEQVPQAQDGYASALYEAWLYLKGQNSWAGMDVKADYPGNNTAATAAKLGLTTGHAYVNGSNKAKYNPPFADGVCATTYIVFIGNNRAPGGGGGSMPYVPPAKNNPPVITTLNTYNFATPANSTLQATWARFLRNRPDLGAGSTAAANGAVITYTLDAYNAQQNLTFTTMMQDMAQVGGGKYFKANNNDELLFNLKFIINEIQAVNSVFAAVSLPVSVNQRGTFLNQVYLGVFRPDKFAAPNWPGNLKLYQIAADTSTNPPTLYLADKNNVAATSASTGFISPGVTSFWTANSTFWSTTYYGNSQGVGGASDAPDGDLVEKGGAAQQLRVAYPSSQDGRKVYTCNGACAAGSSLSATPFATTNASITTAELNAADATERDNIINWVRGANNRNDDNPSGVATDVRGFLHGDVLHSRPAVVNYGGGAGSEKVYVFYGANDGMLHAVKGGQDTASGAGSEAWAFIASEHFGQFKRMRNHSPTISTTDRKPYFIDGSPTVYTLDVNNDKSIVAADGDKAWLFLSMRRGGRFIYALDVTDPTTPKFMWKRSNLNGGSFGEMGQTWSDLRVGKIRASADPVLIFGLGYHASANDTVVSGTITMGRGVIVVNARTGDKIWSSADPADRNGIDYSIPASVAPVDTDGDTYVDRIIAADTGANIWRINIDDPDTTKWTVAKVATLGGSGNAGARRFINTPDVVLSGPQGPAWDAILIGSGDREQPFDTTVVNRFYMVKDNPAKNHVWATPLTETDLYDATLNLVQDGTTAQKAAAKASLETAKGWYITLGVGEKVDGPSTTLSGTTFFGTNTPANNATDICVSNLGIAKTYAVSFTDASATANLNKDAALSGADRSQTIPGGGFPPPPVALQVEIDGKFYQGVAFGTQILQPPGTAFGRRFRSWWFQPVDR